MEGEISGTLLEAVGYPLSRRDLFLLVALHGLLMSPHFDSSNQGTVETAAIIADLALAAVEVEP